MKTEIAEFPVWGLEHIEVGALAQMKTAIKLPIAVAGALMPDAHQDTACRSAACSLLLQTRLFRLQLAWI